MGLVLEIFKSAQLNLQYQMDRTEISGFNMNKEDDRHEGNIILAPCFSITRNEESAATRFWNNIHAVSDGQDGDIWIQYE